MIQLVTGSTGFTSASGSGFNPSFPEKRPFFLEKAGQYTVGTPLGSGASRT